MNRTTRNMIVWAGTVAVCLVLYWTAARTNLHFIRPLLFLGYVAVAAAAITALVCWEFVAAAREIERSTQSKMREEN